MNRRWLSKGLWGSVFLWMLAASSASPYGLQDQAQIEQALKVFNRAKFLHQEGKYEEAIEGYREAARLDEQNPWIFNYLGLALTAARGYQEAIKAFQKALRLNPDITDVHNNLGVVYSEIGEREKAFEEFALVVRDPSYPTPEKPLYNLGNLYFREKNLELAHMHYRRAVEKNPEFALGYRGLGKVHLALNEPEAALKQFHKALEFAPADQGSLYELARLYENQGDLEKAREHYRRVVEADRYSTLGQLSLQRLDLLKPGIEP